LSRHAPQQLGLRADDRQRTFQVVRHRGQESIAQLDCRASGLVLLRVGQRKGAARSELLHQRHVGFTVLASRIGCCQRECAKGPPAGQKRRDDQAWPHD
jgi:hypothetical protein